MIPMIDTNLVLVVVKAWQRERERETSLKGLNVDFMMMLLFDVIILVPRVYASFLSLSPSNSLSMTMEESFVAVREHDL